MGHYTVKTSGQKPKYDHAKIKSLLRAGITDREIEEEVNCPRNAVTYVRRKMGIIRKMRGRPIPSVDVLKIKELYLKGADVAQIAKQMECSRTTVYRWLQLKKHRGIVEAE